jgi:RNA polymerase sigma factor (TIGR02999 family)
MDGSSPGAQTAAEVRQEILLHLAFRRLARLRLEPMGLQDEAALTRLLNRFGTGDSQAAEELAPLVYGELHRLAGLALRGEEARATLQPTALVNEAWMRLAGDTASFEHRSRFFALAAKIMRQVVVDHARTRKAQKRGGDRRPITLLDAAAVGNGGGIDVLDLDQALERLRARDEGLHRMIELRFFGGLTQPEIADVLGLSLRTVERRSRLALAWLRGELDR